MVLGKMKDPSKADPSWQARGRHWIYLLPYYDRDFYLVVLVNDVFSTAAFFVLILSPKRRWILVVFCSHIYLILVEYKYSTDQMHGIKRTRFKRVRSQR